MIRRVLLDTNVFIDYLRDGRHAHWIEGHVAGTQRILSSVVAMELRLGADTLRRRRAVARLRAAFPAGRVLAPDGAAFDRAGDLFARIWPSGSAPADRLGPMNDLLIALTARGVGATVVTGNLDEFARIAARLPGLSLAAP